MSPPLPPAEAEDRGLPRRYGVVKRLLDIACAAVLLLVLAPVLLSAAIAVRFALGSPVIFRQRRPGLGGRPFVLYKFRSMRDAHDGSGADLPDANRLTPFGRLLRSTSIDELPELFNVLLGDMSLIGPRPLLMEYLPKYTPEQARRHDVRPGITGWAQVHGRNAVEWPERFALDVWYVDNCSFLLDLRIVVMTLCGVLRRRGISQPGHATMTKFDGNVA